MLQPRIGALGSREQNLSSLAICLNQLSLCSKHVPRTPQLVFTRHASHAAQGRANGPKDSAGRRLGAKKTASEYVIPGNIIYKQRGTLWYPGENVGMGKDHTIYSKVYGYVQYYKNPAVHQKRKYIGVALEKTGPRSKLPTPPNAITARRLGMYAVPIRQDEGLQGQDFLDAHITAGSAGMDNKPAGPIPSSTTSTDIGTAKPNTIPKPSVRHGGHGISNYDIGRIAETTGLARVEFDRKNRWLAWRKRAKKVKEKMMARASRANRKTKGKKSNKKVNV